MGRKPTYEELIQRIEKLEEENTRLLLKGKNTSVGLEELEVSSLMDQSLIRNIIDYLPVGLQIFDKKGTSQFINKKQREYLGIPDQFTGLGTFNVLTDPYSIKHGAAEIYKKVYREKCIQVRQYEYDFGIQENKWQTRRDKRIFQETIFPILDTQKQVMNVIALLDDITARKHAEQDLKTSEERFRSIFENSISGIVFTDNRGKIILSNSAFEEMLGYSKQDLYNHVFQEFTYKEDLEQERNIILEALKSNNNSCRFEKRYIRKDQSIIWVDISLSVITDKAKNPQYYVAVINDQTRRKRIEQELLDTLNYNKNIMDTSPVGIARANSSGQIDFANQQAEKILGLQKKDIYQRTYSAPEWQITDFEGKPFPVDQLPFTIVKNTKKSVYDIRHAIEWKNGKRVYLSINASPQVNDKNEFMGMIAAIEDITEKVRAENQMKEDFAFRSAMIKNAAQGLCVYHNITGYPYEKFTVWNDMMTRITGYTIEEINNKGWFSLLHPDHDMQKKAKSRMRQMWEGNNLEAEEWLIHRKDKERRTISISTSFISTQEGENHVMALIDDITERKVMEKALKKSNEQLIDLNATKDRFLSILAHDLKNPVGSLVGLSDILIESIEDEEFSRLHEIACLINQSAKNSFNLLLNLLEWSRAQTRNITMSPREINVFDLVRNNLQLLDQNIKSKKIRARVIMDKNFTILADQHMIDTIIRNLLSNAIKYTNEEGEVTVKGARVSDFSVVEVHDTGVGIDPEQIDKIFDLDSPYTSRGTADETGTGLGLVICKEFIEKHQGTISVESKLKQGTAFTFKIPHSFNNLKE